MISLRPLREFWEAHPDAERPLREWYRTSLAAEWRSLAEVRQVYRHADGVKADSGEILTVFNIGGNKYRLIARIRYDYQVVNVRAIVTHEEYDRGAWKD